MVTCPKCGSDSFYRRRPCIEYSYIDGINSDGSIEVGESRESVYTGFSMLECGDCGVELTVDEYLAMKEIVDEETKAQEVASE